MDNIEDKVDKELKFKAICDTFFNDMNEIFNNFCKAIDEEFCNSNNN